MRPLAEPATCISLWCDRLCCCGAYYGDLCGRWGLATDNPGAWRLQPALPKIPDRTFNVRDFGATGDGKTLDTAAFQKALAKVKAEGGGKLVVPQGTYLILPIDLCSNLDLHLEKGAVLQAPSTFTEYGLPEPETLSSQEEVAAKVKIPQPLIYGKDLHDVAISGTGTIDGAGATWWAWSERAMRAQPGRLFIRGPKWW